MCDLVIFKDSLANELFKLMSTISILNINLKIKNTVTECEGNY